MVVREYIARASGKNASWISHGESVYGRKFDIYISRAFSNEIEIIQYPRLCLSSLSSRQLRLAKERGSISKSRDFSRLPETRATRDTVCFIYSSRIFAANQISSVLKGKSMPPGMSRASKPEGKKYNVIYPRSRGTRAPVSLSLFCFFFVPRVAKSIRE